MPSCKLREREKGHKSGIVWILSLSRCDWGLQYQNIKLFPNASESKSPVDHVTMKSITLSPSRFLSLSVSLSLGEKPAEEFQTCFDAKVRVRVARTPTDSTSCTRSPHLPCPTCWGMTGNCKSSYQQKNIRKDFFLCVPLEIPVIIAVYSFLAFSTDFVLIQSYLQGVAAVVWKPCMSKTVIVQEMENRSLCSIESNVITI